MSENPLHYLSDAPCKKCKGRTRYKSTNNCVPCAKAAVMRKRASVVSEAASQLLIAALLDDGSDLL